MPSSSSATEHWFLDLDGVRSGPYQTPEIMSLIAEGEVLPHHRISNGLKDQSWVTILDWRLEQAKKTSVHESEVKEVRSYIPASAQPPAHAPEKVTVEIQTEPEVAPETIPEEPLTESPLEFHPEPAPAPSEVKPPLPASESAPKKINQPVARPVPPAEPADPTPSTPKPVVTPKPIPATQASTPLTPTPLMPSESPPPQPSAKAGSGRDPMAELFDVLQTSKQKREAKSQQLAQQQNETLNDSFVPRSSNKGLSKTIGIGVVITVLGFALGQVFQQSAPPPSENTAAENSADVHAPNTSPTPFAKTKVIDRSTDKITIQARVQQKTEAQKPAQNKAETHSMIAAAATPHPTEKELQEVKDLKKELQELKALKEELRHGNDNRGNTQDDTPDSPDDYDNGNPNTDIDPGYNYYPVAPNPNDGSAAYPNAAYPNGYPNPAYPQYPANPYDPSYAPYGAQPDGQPSPNSDVHY